MGLVGSTNFQITKKEGMRKRLMSLMNRMKKFRVSQEKHAQNIRKSTKSANQAFRALQTAEESVKNLDKRLARFFDNYFDYILHELFSF